MNLKQLSPGQQISETFAVLKVEECLAANGNPYKTVELSHSTGTIKGQVWSESFVTCPLVAGKVFHIQATVKVYRDIYSLTISQAYEREEPFEDYINPRPTLVFDIETVGKPYEDLDDWDQHYFVEGLERHEPDKEVAKQKTGLHALYGFVATIGMLNPDSGKGMVFVNGSKEVKPENDLFTYRTFDSEKELLEAFWELAPKYERFVTFNGNQFDFPFLALRSAINRVKITLELHNRQETYVDLMYKFRGSSNYKLEALCRALGITNPKEKGVSGLHVSQLFRDGKIQEICDYVARDVVSTSELYKIWKQYVAGKIIV